MSTYTTRRIVSVVLKLDEVWRRHPGRMSAGRFWSFVLLICASLFMAPAAANTDDDPLGLLVGYDVS